ncbi:MAG: nucleotide exchange factor GrpE [Defluviitaleaceae bacterium]|nr:nucleotide exchange factor GrpE [Defluviitaleaceae bacterium]MCL2275864.1 nucleotide exchange factor GrpE [Defluviitaleaceae bacterium]
MKNENDPPALEETLEAEGEENKDTPCEGEVSDSEEGEVLDPPSADTLYKETLDRYTRTLAEFDNFRKRTVKEKAAQYDAGMCAAAEKMLTLVDNFDRAMASGEATHGEDTFYQGIAMIARQFTDALKDLNVVEISAEAGTAFDPNLHNAVAHEENDAFGTNEISAVLQKGYMYKDRVLRHSMVKVAN